MSEDSSLPVLIGVGAAHQRIAEPGGGLDTTALMTDAVVSALADSGVAALTEKVDWIGATRGLSGLPDAARRIAEALGVEAFTVAADVGIPQQTLVNHALEAIRSGRARVAVVCGGETKFRDDTARRAGVELPGHDQAGLVPDLDMSGRPRTPVTGEIPNPIDPPSGCAFHPRCPLANERCRREVPQLLPAGDAIVACHAVAEGRAAA